MGGKNVKSRAVALNAKEDRERTDGKEPLRTDERKSRYIMEAVLRLTYAIILGGFCFGLSKVGKIKNEKLSKSGYWR